MNPSDRQGDDVNQDQDARGDSWRREQTDQHRDFYKGVLVVVAIIAALFWWETAGPGADDAPKYGCDAQFEAPGYVNC
jgi:hypothetical protein